MFDEAFTDFKFRFELKTYSYTMPDVTPPTKGPNQYTQWLSHLLRTNEGPSERAGFRKGIETKLHAPYANPIAVVEFPIIVLMESVEMKYERTTTKVKMNSTPNLSQAGKEALCEIVVCRFP